jgi:molybdate transport system ATP-binding protein
MPAHAVAESGLRVRATLDSPVRLDIDFSVSAGTVAALVGPSGSGKTSTLRAIAGFVRPGHGRIECDDEIWFDAEAGVDVAPRRRRVGLVFQSYALFPHLSAIENVAAALGDLPAGARRDEARALLSRVHLAGLEDRKPWQLSGGQQQRVAVARALARRPRALLLDEPFSAVDRSTRTRLQAEMAELRASLSIPIVLVTHDLDEVARLADTVVLLAGTGTIASGTVNEIFGRSDLRRYTGIFEISTVLHARIVSTDASTGAAILDHPAGRLMASGVPGAPGTIARLRVRARDVAIAVGEPGNISIRNRLAATVDEIAGADDQAVDVRLKVGDDVLVARITREAVNALDLKVGQPVVALVKATAIDRPGDGD